MEKITELNFFKDFMRMCDDGWNLGWHERNAGNLTYRLTKEDVESAKKFFTFDEPWVELSVEVKNLSNEYFIATGTGKYFRNVLTQPEKTICIVLVNETGTACKIVWGSKNNVRPTSELPTHLLNHSVKYDFSEGNHRVIYHAHTPNVIALTAVLPCTDKAITNALWRSASECPVVYPEGVGIVEWMVPGGREIALATAEKMKGYNAVVWKHHGLFCSGSTFDETFGLMHTIEKAAQIYILALSTGAKNLYQMSDTNLRMIAKDFKVILNESLI